MPSAPDRARRAMEEDMLEELGRPILATGITKTEAAIRRVDQSIDSLLGEDEDRDGRL